MQTERILLRPWHDDDAAALYKIRTLFHSDHIWAIELKCAGGDASVPSGEPIGCIGYYTHGESNIDIGENDAEVGYWVARPYWNHEIGFRDTGDINYCSRLQIGNDKPVRIMQLEKTNITTK